MEGGPFSEILQDLTVAVGIALGVLGFFRGLEQRKDDAFSDLTVRLGQRGKPGEDSPVLRVAAANQLPGFFRYRRFYFFRRPYRRQALELASNALKMEDFLFVRQVLVDSLMTMLGSLTVPERQGVRLICARLEKLIMNGFDFAHVDLTEAHLTDSGLEGTRFVHARLWKANLSGSNLQQADFTGARLWDADLSRTNLRGAKLLTSDIEGARFQDVNLAEAELSQKVAACCRQQNCDLSKAVIR